VDKESKKKNQAIIQKVIFFIGIYILMSRKKEKDCEKNHDKTTIIPSVNKNIVDTNNKWSQRESLAHTTRIIFF